MDFFTQAFGGFDPCSDRDAAIKFALNSILMDERLNMLRSLIDEGNEIGCIEGQPGWEIERLFVGERGSNAFSERSGLAAYRVSVEPDSYHLTYPECFLEEKHFLSYTLKAVHAYHDRFPNKKELYRELEELIIGKHKRLSAED